MHLVDHPQRLEALVARLNESCGRAPRAPVFLDTEFESARSGKTLSLVQISAGQSARRAVTANETGEDVYVVDALRVTDLMPLRPLLADRDRCWVLHAGAQDLELLLPRLGLEAPPRLFDTQVAWGLMSPEGSVSLAYLKYRLLGIRSMKTHQADDWIRRPLPSAQLNYAASDVQHLAELYVRLRLRAGELERDEAIEEASLEIALPEPSAEAETLSLASFRNAWQLEPENLAALALIIDWYNGLGPAGRARAPQPKTLIAVASRLPRTARELARIKGISERWCREHGDAFIKLLRKASARRGDDVPAEPPPYATWEEIRLEGWIAHMRAEVSARCLVAPELAFPQRIVRGVREIIRKTGDRRAGARALNGWRSALLAEAYGAFCDETGLGSKDSADRS